MSPEPPPTSSLLAPRSQHLDSSGLMFAKVCRLRSMQLPSMISSQAANLPLRFENKNLKKVGWLAARVGIEGDQGRWSQRGSPAYLAEFNVNEL